MVEIHSAVNEIKENHESLVEKRRDFFPRPCSAGKIKLKKKPTADRESAVMQIYAKDILDYMIKTTMQKKLAVKKIKTQTSSGGKPRSRAFARSKVHSPRKWEDSAYAMNPDIRGYFPSRAYSQ